MADGGLGATETPPPLGGIATFATSANGDVAPDLTLVGANNGINGAPILGVVADANSLFVLCVDNGDFSGPPAFYVAKFNRPASGDVAPASTTYIALASGDGFAGGLAIDGTNLYVLDKAFVPSVRVFALSSFNSSHAKETPLAATRVISGSNTGMMMPNGIAVDSSYIYVANFTNTVPAGDNVLMFPVAASGDVAPSKTITGLTSPLSVAADGTTVFVLSSPSNFGEPSAVTSYTVATLPGSGDATAARTLTSPVVSGSAAYLAVDASNIYVGDMGDFASPGPAIRVFPKTADGAATPTATIIGPNALQSVVGLFVAASSPPAAPTVSSTGVPLNSTYDVGQNLDFTVTYSTTVTVNSAGGVPYLNVMLDTGGTVQANYVAGTGTSTLTFRYTVAAGNLDANGITVASSITLNGGTIKDGSGNDAPVTGLSFGSTAEVLVGPALPPSNTSTIFVADNGLQTSGGVAIFAHGASGNVLPDAALVGLNTTIDSFLAPIVAVVADANAVYVLGNEFTPEIHPFIRKYSRPTSGNTAPVTTAYITLSSGANGFATALAIDGTNLYVLDNGTSTTDSGGVNVYALSGFNSSHGMGSPLAPTRSIAGADTAGFNHPNGLAVDSNYIYVANTQADNLLMFALGASGDVAPARTITGLAKPVGVAVDSTTAFVLNGRSSPTSGPRVTTYTLSTIGAGGAVAPATTIGSGSFTDAVFYLASGAGNVYVGDPGDPFLDVPIPPGVHVFSKTADGSSVSPIRTLTGPMALTSVAGLSVAPAPSTDAPTVTPSGGSTAFTPGGGAVAVDSAVTLTAVPPTLSTATIQITSGLAVEDVLAFTNSNPATFGNIESVYIPPMGIFRLFSDGATATKAQWQSALRAVTFDSTSSETASRTLDLKVFDGAQTSAAGSKTVAVAAPGFAPTVSDSTSTDVTATTATLGGNVVSDGGATLTERGVVYSSTDTSPEIGETGVTKKVEGGTGSGVFSMGVTGLTAGTQYTYRAYATNSVGTSYSTIGTFTTSVLDATAPTLSSVTIASSNAAPSRAKAGDTITVTITASEALASPGPSVTIAGRPAIIAGSGTSWTATTTLQGDDLEGVVAISITDFADLAANAGAAVSATTNSSMVTIDRTAPTLSSAVIASNNADSARAKTGDVVTLTLTASETLAFPGPSATFGGRPATVTGSGNTWTATWTMATGDPEGPMVFSIAFTDLAGNAGSASATTNGSAVTFDRSAPATPGAVTGTASQLTGTAEVGSTVKLYGPDGTTVLATTTADGSGNWTIALASPLAGGSYTLTTTDAAGNESSVRALVVPAITGVIPTSGPATIASIEITGVNFGPDASHVNSVSYASQNSPRIAWPSFEYLRQNAAILHVTPGTLSAGQTYDFTITVNGVESPRSTQTFTVNAPTYTVTYDANGGGVGDPPIDTTLYPAGSLVTVRGAMNALAGYTFGGWNTASGGTGTRHDVQFTITGNTTLYAQWVPFTEPTVTVNVGTGSVPYTGSAPVVTTNTGGSTGAVTLTYEGINGTNYPPTTVPPTKVGHYTVTATVASAGTYTAGSSLPIAFKILPVITDVAPLVGAANVATAIALAGDGFGPGAGSVSVGSVSYGLVGGPDNQRRFLTQNSSGPRIDFFNQNTSTVSILTDTDMVPGDYDFTITVNGVESPRSIGAEAIFVARQVPTITNVTLQYMGQNLASTVTFTGSGFSTDLSKYTALAYGQVGTPLTYSYFAQNQATVLSVTSEQLVVSSKLNLVPSATYDFTVEADGLTLARPSAGAGGSTVTVGPQPTITSISPSAGAAAIGTIITLSGTNFSGTGPAPAVTYGPAGTGSSLNDVTVVTSSQLTGTLSTALAPGQSVKFVVTVGGVASAPSVSTFNAVAPPTIDAVAPAAGPALTANTITLTGSNFGANSAGITSITYGANGTGSIASNPSWISSTQVSANVGNDIPAGTSVRFIVTIQGVASAPSTATYMGVAVPTIVAVTPDSGAANTASLITLIGTNFGANGSVSIGASYGSAGGGRRPLTGLAWISSTQVSGTTGTDIGPGESVNFDITINGVASAPSSATFRTTPAVTSPTVGNVASTSTTLGGTVASNPLAITGRGVVYAVTATNSDPRIGGSGVFQGGTSGTVGTFVVPVSNLSPSTGYTFRAYATNSAGTSYSPVGTFITPAPVTPVITGITPASGPANVSTTLTLTGTNFGVNASRLTGGTYALQNTGGTRNPIPFFTQNTATPYIRYVNQNTATLVTGTGLDAGVYDFTVMVDGVPSLPSTQTFTAQVPQSAPSAPTSVTATAGNSQAIVTFSPPANSGGSVITSYTVTPNPGGNSVIVLTSPVTLTGLVNGTTYTFAVTATNSVGVSPAAVSNSVTPAAPPAPMITGVSPLSGPASISSITINGLNFGANASHLNSFSYAAQNTSRVYVHNQNTAVRPAIQYLGQNQAIFLPASTTLGAGKTYDFTITVDGVESAVSTAKFTTEGAPPVVPTPIISAIVPSDHRANRVITITIMGANFGATLSDVTGATYGSASGGRRPLTQLVHVMDTVVTGKTGTDIAPGETIDADITVKGVRSAVSTSTFTAVAEPIITSVSPATGAANVSTTLTLTGTNFGASAASLTGGTYALQNTATRIPISFSTQNTGAAYIQYVDQNTATLVAGAGLSPGAYDFTITVDGVQSAVSTARFTTFAVNHAPDGADRTFTMAEDAVFALGLAEFGFTDPNDAPAHALASVKVTTLPAAGVLALNGSPISAGTLVSAADLAATKLTFKPAADANGTAYASFTYQVQDNGGTANGGVDLDASPNTITFNVTPVNDAPSFALASNGATLTGFLDPTALAVDGLGNLYVADGPNSAVSVFAPGATTPTATLTGFENPAALALDGSDNLYVASMVNGTISKFAPGATTPSATLTGFSNPGALAVDGSGNLYVGDVVNGTIGKFAPGATTPSATLDAGIYPDALAIDGSGNLYVATSGDATVKKFAPGATTASEAFTGLSGAAALAVDGSGNLYVAHQGSVSKFAPGATTASATFTEVGSVSALAIDGFGNLYGATSPDTVTKFAVGDTVVAGIGAQTRAGFATNITDGDPEVTQALTFGVTTTNPALFLTPPAIAPNGTLTYTAGVAAGTATVSVTLTDDATAGGPAQTSPAQTFAITVTTNPAFGVPTITSITPSTGSITGGTVVTITGTNFTNGAVVNFGDVVATSAMFVNSKQIIATAPAAAPGTGQITVTTPGGTSAPGSGSQFTSVIPAVITSVSPASGPALTRTILTLTGTNFGASSDQLGSATYRRSGSNPVSVTKNTTTTAETYLAQNSAVPALFYVDQNTAKLVTGADLAAGEYDFSLLVDGVSSARSTPTFTANAFAVTLSPSTPIRVATDGTFTLSSAVSGPGGLGALTYAWTVSPALAGLPSSLSSTSLPVNLARQRVLVPGTYTVSLTVHAAGPGQAVTASQVVTVQAPPSGGSATATPSTLTAFQPVTLAAPGWINHGTGALRYQWSRVSETGAVVNLGDLSTHSTLETAQLPSGQASSNHSYNLTLRVVDDLGQSTSTSVPVTVKPIAPVITGATNASGQLTTTGVLGRSFLYQVATATTQAQFTATGLPAGLSINPTSGAISGAPTEGGVFTVSVTVSNVTASATTELSLTIDPPPPIINSAASARGRQGTPFAFEVAAVNNPTSYTATGLPAGLTLDVVNSEAFITGTPTVSGVFQITLSATNAGGTSTSPFVLTIDPPLTAPVYTGLTKITGRQNVLVNVPLTFTNGPVTLAPVSGTLPVGVSLVNGVINGTPTQTGVFTYTFAATNTIDGADSVTTNVTLTLTINPPPNGPKITSASTGNGQVGVDFSYQITTSAPVSTYVATGLPAGLNQPDASGLITGQPSAQGTYTVQLAATNGDGTSPVATFVITVSPSADAPTITSSPVLEGEVGVAFNQTLVTNNAATGFAVTSGSMPPGLNLPTAAGAITGTPTQPGQFTAWIAASNGSGSGYALQVVFDIAPANTTPVITSNGTAAAQAGQPFFYQITATNEPTSFGAEGLPDGLSLATDTGVISGLPRESTTTAVEIVLTASKGDVTSAPKTLLLSIAPAEATPVILDPLSSDGAVGDNAFSYQIRASDTPTSFVALNLPGGLELNSTTGLITGTPTSADTFHVTVRAGNAAGLGAPRTLVIRVMPAATAPAIGGAPSASGTVGESFSYSITTVPAKGTATSYAHTGTLPLGLTLDTSTGVISGRPTTPGVTRVQLTASGDGGTSMPQEVVFTIASADAAPKINGPYTKSGTVGELLTYIITARSTPDFPSAPFPAPFTLDAASLPPGLAVNSSTGIIMGKPTAAGQFSSTLVGTNAAGTGPLATLTFDIAPAPNAPAVNADSQQSAQVGRPFSYQFSGSNNPTSYEVLGAPKWMTVNNTSGILAGTPTSPTKKGEGLVVRLIAKNAGGASAPFLLTIDVAASATAPVVVSERLASGTLNQEFQPVRAGKNYAGYQIAASVPSGAPAVASYVASGLPDGLGLDQTTGLITGTPIESGQFEVALIARNSAGEESQPVTLILSIVGTLNLAPISSVNQ